MKPKKKTCTALNQFPSDWENFTIFMHKNRLYNYRKGSIMVDGKLMEENLELEKS
jgi:hypothetical protein